MFGSNILFQCCAYNLVVVNSARSIVNTATVDRASYTTNVVHNMTAPRLVVAW
ncbi:MAG TPA: hypothetical protein VK133_02980 [Amoebophilaceae bacterium]|nr:hypothetical protein [Amoebophilaceae bacterium]